MLKRERKKEVSPELEKFRKEIYNLRNQLKLKKIVKSELKFKEVQSADLLDNRGSLTQIYNDAWASSYDNSTVQSKVLVQKMNTNQDEIETFSKIVNREIENIKFYLNPAQHSSNE